MDSLKILRKRAGKSMRLTAEELGIPYTTYVSYEKGTREPNSEMLVKIAEHYRTTVDFLLGRQSCACEPVDLVAAPKMKQAPLVGAIACGTPTLAEDLSAEELEIVSILRKMSPEQLARELAYLRQASADGQDKQLSALV